MRSLNRGNIEGANGLKIDVSCLYMDFCFTFAKWLGFLDWLEKAYVYLRKGFQFCVLPTSYDCLKKKLNTYKFLTWTYF